MHRLISIIYVLNRSHSFVLGIVIAIVIILVIHKSIVIVVAIV